MHLQRQIGCMRARCHRGGECHWNAGSVGETAQGEAGVLQRGGAGGSCHSVHNVTVTRHSVAPLGVYCTAYPLISYWKVSFKPEKHEDVN